jgi:hypothetical protein
MRSHMGDTSKPSTLANSQAQEVSSPLARICLVPVYHKNDVCDAAGIWKVFGWLEDVAVIVVFVAALSVRDVTLFAMILVCACTLIIPRALWKAIRKRRCRRMGSTDIAELTGKSAEGDAKLVCYGELVELEAIQHPDPYLTAPAIFREVPHGSLLRLRSSSPYGILKILLVLCTAGFVLYVVFDNPILFFVALVVLKWGWDALIFAWRPVYYRVAPGRLDILRFGFFKLKAKSRRSVSLRDARIVCRYDKGVLEISPMPEGIQRTPKDAAAVCEPAPPLTIDLGSLPERHAFAHAVFQSAVSDRSVPDSPDGELLG